MKEKFPADPTVSCFINKRVRINQLTKMLPELSEKSEIGVRYTNHSFQATAITHMFKLALTNSPCTEAIALECDIDSANKLFVRFW